MNIDTSSLNALVKKSANKTPTISIINARNLTKDCIDIAAISTVAMEAEDVADTFRRMSKGRAAVIPGTVRNVMNTMAGNVIKFSAKFTRPSKSFAETASMVKMGDGVYSDGASVWAVQGEGDTARIVMQSSEDINDIIEMYRSRSGVNEAMMTRKVNLASGDFASYITPGSSSLSYGFVHSISSNGAVIGNINTKTIDRIDAASIINSAQPSKRKPLANYDVAKGDSMKAFWDYLSMVYPADYIAAYKKAVGN